MQRITLADIPREWIASPRNRQRCDLLSGEYVVSLRICHAGDLRVGERVRLTSGQATDGGNGEGIDLVGGHGRDLLRRQVRHFGRGQPLYRVRRDRCELCS